MAKTVWPFVVGTICFVVAVIIALSLGFGMHLFQTPPTIPKSAFTAAQCQTGCNVSGVVTDKPALFAFSTSNMYNVTIVNADPQLYGQVCISVDEGLCYPLQANVSFTICCVANLGVQRYNQSNAKSFFFTFVTTNLNQGYCLGCPYSTIFGWIAFILVVGFLSLFGFIFCCAGCCCLVKESSSSVQRH